MCNYFVINNSVRNLILSKNRCGLVLFSKINFIKFSYWFNNFIFLVNPYQFQFFKFISEEKSKLFVKKFYIKGIGYKFIRSKRKLSNFIKLELGYSRSFYISIPVNIFVKHTRDKLLMISPSKSSLTNFSKFIQNFRYPDPYKAKGIRIIGVDYTNLKPGKQRLNFFY